MAGINNEDLLRCIAEGLTIWETIDKLNCSRNTIINKMKDLCLATPKGFFKTGKKAGRPIGTKQPKEAVEAMRKRVTGAGNGFYGCKHSENAKKKMRENHADFSGAKNPYRKFLEQNPDERTKAAERAKKAWANFTEEELEARNTKLSLAMANSEFHKNSSSLKCHHHGHLETKKGGRIFFRSSWEKEFALFLDSDHSVRTFSSEPFCVQYKTKDGSTRYTRPDFLIHTELVTYLVEIKPSALLNLNNNTEKFAGLKEYAKHHNMVFRLCCETQIERIKEFNVTSPSNRCSIEAILQNDEEVEEQAEGNNR